MLVRGPFHKLEQLYHEMELSDGTLVDGDNERLKFAVACFKSLDRMSGLTAKLTASLKIELSQRLEGMENAT